MEQMGLIRKQVDSRSKQVDKLDLSVKAAADSQARWKQRVMLKQEEIEAAKVRPGFLLVVGILIASRRPRTASSIHRYPP